MAQQKRASKTRRKAAKTGIVAFLEKRPLLVLAVLVIVVYGASVGFGFTKLDDTIFIQDYKAYNEDLGNLITSFKRGVFNETKDTYYRPLFLDAMIINNIFSGQNIAGYHFVNLLLHLGVVLLLFRFLIALRIRKLYALILAAIFAIHPVLTQNVVWIPGRNDTLLAIFVLLFLIKSIRYQEHGKTPALLWSFFWLLCAYFTKETAVFAPVTAFLILVLVLKTNWRARSNLIQYGTWVLAFAIWYGVRAMATIVPSEMQPAELWSSFIARVPVLIQYLGKIFLPFNLSVFPIMEDTGYLYGIISIGILIAILALAKHVDWKIVIAGALIFLSFLIPVFLVPKAINTQTFEHRLYLPMIGMLLIFSQSILIKNRLNEKQLVIMAAVLVAFFAVLNLRHQRNFTDELSFWQQAVKTSPHSAYALMMLGAKLPNPEDGARLFRKAYAIDSTEKYLNYYYGAMLQYEDSIPESEPYLLKEKERSDYVEVDFMLARVAVEKGDLQGGIHYLESFLKRSPTHELANKNLLQLYIQTGNMEKARAQAISMQQKGLPVPQDLKTQLGL